MTDAPRLLLGSLQGLFLILIAPGVIGLLRFLKGRTQRRQAAGVLQPYRDLLKLLQVQPVRSAKTSWVFALAPYVMLAAYSSLAFMIPVVNTSTLIAGDFVMIVYMLGLARFMLSMAGMDAGAPFSGLGSSRVMFFHFLTEIGLLLFVLSMSFFWQTTNVLSILENQNSFLPTIIAPYQNSDTVLQSVLPNLSMILLGLALASLILLEAGRIPFDNPETHLELTMLDKAIELEYAGRDLAILQWAEDIKLVFLLTLFVQIFLPFWPLPDLQTSGSLLLEALLMAGYAIKIILVVVALMMWESWQSTIHLRAVPALVIVAIVLSLSALIFHVAFLTFARGQ